VNGIKKIFIISVLLLGFLLSSCLEAEVEIDLKRDGSGEMRMKILPLESSMNFLINEVEPDLRRNQNYRDSDIRKGSESDGRNSLFIRKKFKSIEEADENCRFVSHKEYDEFAMSIPHDYLGIVKKVKVNMPNQIINSNVRGFKGRSLVWERTRPSDNRLFIKSKSSGPIGKEFLLAIILAVAVFGITFLIILTKIQKRKVTHEKFSFCPECGTKVNSDNNFCQNCGQSLK
jgi:ribosomal protein S27AE